MQRHFATFTDAAFLDAVETLHVDKRFLLHKHTVAFFEKGVCEFFGYKGVGVT